MASRRNPRAALFTLEAANDLDGVQDETRTLDLTGSGGCVILAGPIGTDGTAGIDVIMFSRDGGITYKAATAANIGNGHGGLRDSTGAAVTGAAMNAAGVEAVTAAAMVFTLGPVDGPFRIKCNRKTGDFSDGGTTWVTGAPNVSALRID